jgi:hypothetical protein
MQSVEPLSRKCGPEQRARSGRKTGEGSSERLGTRTQQWSSGSRMGKVRSLARKAANPDRYPGGDIWVRVPNVCGKRALVHAAHREQTHAEDKTLRRPVGCPGTRTQSWMAERSIGRHWLLLACKKRRGVKHPGKLFGCAYPGERREGFPLPKGPAKRVCSWWACPGSGPGLLLCLTKQAPC